MRLRDKSFMQAVYFINAIGFGVWFPRIPDVKADLGLDLWTLSLCLVCIPISSMIGFLTLPGFVQRMGLRTACIWAGAGMMPCMLAIAFATGPLSLALTFLVLGQFIAMIETAINAKVNDLELQSTGPKIMSQCHGFWSFGAMAGALIGGAFAQADISFFTQQMILQPLFALAAFGAGFMLPPDSPKTETPSSAFALPSAGLVLLCILPIGALMIEGAFLDWSVLFARETLMASPFAASTALASFTMTMGIMRLFGDRLSARFEPVPVIRASALIMAVGVFGFALSPNILTAIPCAILAGAGCAVLYPLTMSLAANQEGRSATQNVAAVSFFGFGAFLIGPPLIGLIASQASLAVAFACLTPLAAYPIFLAGKAAQRP